MPSRQHGRHAGHPNPAGPSRSAVRRRQSRVRETSLTSIGAALGVVLLASSAIDPSAGAAAAPLPSDVGSVYAAATQTYDPSGSAELTLERSSTVDTQKLAVASSGTATSASTNPAGESAPTIPASQAQEYAHEQVIARGWSESDFSCLVKLWNRESHWNYKAFNRGSGAYGIPQALPGSKMASAGSDWATNPATQIEWGLGYISGRYSTPCGAWSHSQSTGWY